MNKKSIWLLTICLLASVHLAEAQQPAKVWRIGLSHVGLDHVHGCRRIEVLCSVEFGTMTWGK